jgi:hypothetical protein
MGIPTKMQFGWDASSDRIKIECNLSNGWDERPAPKKYNWFASDKVDHVPPRWGRGSPKGKLTVWMEQFRGLPDPDAHPIVEATGKSILDDIQFYKKDENVLMKATLRVANGGTRVPEWSKTTSTQEKKDKLEFSTTIVLPGRNEQGQLYIRLVLEPPGPRVPPDTYQGTGSKHIVSGGLPS